MTPQSTAAFITVIGLALMIGAFYYVSANASEAEEYEGVQGRAYALRRQIFIVLLVGFFLVPALTLRSMPYSIDPAASSTIVVEVTAHQWYWEISQESVPAGRPVLFRVESEDVNHGFALYDPEKRVVAQVQAMPGYVNELAVEFDSPGTYQILCLEYCGLVHHGMLGQINVTSGS